MTLYGIEIFEIRYKKYASPKLAAKRGADGVWQALMNDGKWKNYPKPELITDDPSQIEEFVQQERNKNEAL